MKKSVRESIGRKFSLAFIWASLVLVQTVQAVPAQKEVPVAPHKSWSFYQVGLTPVQNGGRIKPLDSFAREVVLYETGSRSFKGWDAIDLIFSWIAFPKYWEDQPFIRVGREDVRKQLGLDDERTFYSPRELFKNTSLIQYAERMGHSAQAEPPGAPKASARDQELKTVLERLGLFHSFVTGQAWLLIPKPAPAAWVSLVDHDKEGDLIRTQFVDVLKAYQTGDQAQFERSSVLLRSAIEGEIPQYNQSQKTEVLAESFYNHMRPFGIAWILYLLAALAWITIEFLKPVQTSKTTISRMKKLGAFLLSSALLVQVFGILLRCYVAGRPPVTNMYESVIWVSFGVVVFAIVLYRIQRQSVVLAVACVLALLGLVAGDSAPAMMDPSIRPLVPVLRSNYWLTIHVLTITLGYAAFALTLGLANITLFHFLSPPNPVKKSKIAQLNQLTYRAMQFGVVLIAAGTILGGIWADYSWGRFWGWDPKEVWALITLLCYLVILHGRYTNWVGAFGFAALSALSFMSVVMAWYGVNFVLGVGLHSYGFATGGAFWVVSLVSVQLVYILLVTWVKFKRPFFRKTIAQ